MVREEGLEPSKAHGRQIYSLLRLTASLPRRLRCLDEAVLPRRPPKGKLAKGFEPPTG